MDAWLWIVSTGKPCFLLAVLNRSVALLICLSVDVTMLSAVTLLGRLPKKAIIP